MTRCYTVNFTPTSETVAVDLIALKPATNIPIRLRALRIWQISDFGDAQAEILTINVVRGNATDGSGGATATPLLKDKRDASASFTARVGDTTAASAGTAETVYSTGWPVGSAFEYTFPDPNITRTDAGQTMLVIRLGGAPADALTIGCSVDVEEI